MLDIDIHPGTETNLPCFTLQYVRDGKEKGEYNLPKDVSLRAYEACSSSPLYMFIEYLDSAVSDICSSWNDVLKQLDRVISVKVSS